MADTKMKTVIANRTEQPLVLRVGNQNHRFAKLATIAVGGEHILEIDVNWTFQEFFLEPASIDTELAATGIKKKVAVSSDDCCDFERMTVTESQGNLQVEKTARGRESKCSDGQPALRNLWPLFSWPKFKWRFWL